MAGSVVHRHIRGNPEHNVNAGFVFVYERTNFLVLPFIEFDFANLYAWNTGINISISVSGNEKIFFKSFIEMLL